MTVLPSWHTLSPGVARSESSKGVVPLQAGNHALRGLRACHTTKLESIE